jgi:hypothetical protein
MNLALKQNKILKVTREIALRSHVKIKLLTEEEQNHSYKSDFVLYNSQKWEHIFCVQYDENKNIGLVQDSSWNWIHELRGLSSIESAIQESFSRILIKFFQYERGGLSCRQDTSSLDKYRSNRSISIKCHPTDWVLKNEYFEVLTSKKFYKKLINYVCNKRWLFLKVWDFEAQKNYFHTSVNGGLPITKKRDEYHEWTFMVHDFFHFLFLDPLITGKETEAEKMLYIATRMMGEACTLILADMISIDHSNIGESGYDTARRRIFPLFQSTKLDSSSLESIKKLMFANSVYCLFGDDNEWKRLWAWIDELESYKSKYKKFFSGDFSWNELNITCVMRKFDVTTAMKGYFEATHFLKDQYTTHSLSKLISMNWTFSFEKLFEIFWSQFESFLHYSGDFSLVEYRRSTALKYLSGQLLIRYLYEDTLKKKYILDEFDICFKEAMYLLNITEDANEIENMFEEQNRKIWEMIDFLWVQWVLLPHEVMIHHLHVPHFDPIYVSYDKTDEFYEPLEQISQRLLGPFLKREYIPLRVVSSHSQNLYNKLI